MTSYEIDEKLTVVLRQMEKNGAKLDVGFLEELSQKIGLKLLKLETSIYESVGENFNINSPSQIAKILYEKLKIEPSKSGIRRRKTHHSTSADDLKKIKNLHPVIGFILEFRELAKLKNTYLDPLPKLVDKNQRLHTTYAIDTATGRLSSKNPNLQNIPACTEASADKPAWGGEVRKAFVTELGYKLLAADYSQIELRVAAHLSGDRTMLDIFHEGKDIHKATAIELGVDRRTAKVINFGILYGMSAYGVGETLKIPTEEAQILIDKYFLAYPRLAAYIEELIREAGENGYVETMFGRRRYIPELQSSVERLRRFGQRIAINTPIQGTAAEIIKLAMIEIARKLKSGNNDKLIMQIHDELILEVRENEIQKTAKMVKDAMEQAVQLKVPIVVNLSTGKNWGNLQELKI